MESGSAHCTLFQRVCSWNLLCQWNVLVHSITWAYIIENTASNVSYFKRVCILDFACIWFYHTSHEPWSWTHTHTHEKKSDVNTVYVYRLSLLQIPLAVRFMCSSHTARSAQSRLVFMSIALIMQCGRVSLETSSNEIFSGFFIFIFALILSFIHPSFCSPYHRTYSTLVGMPTSFNTMHKQHTITHKWQEIREQKRNEELNLH